MIITLSTLGVYGKEETIHACSYGFNSDETELHINTKEYKFLIIKLGSYVSKKTSYSGVVTIYSGLKVITIRNE